MFPQLKQTDIEVIIEKNNLEKSNNLKEFVSRNKENYSFSTLSKIIEYANLKRQKNSAYFTNKFIIQEIFENLPSFDSDELNIIEPSVGSGNFFAFYI